jgi:hypothetical protein
MPRRNEEPQSDASEGSTHDYTSEEEEEKYTRLPPITRERDANAKATMIELLHRLKDLIEHNVT